MTPNRASNESNFGRILRFAGLGLLVICTGCVNVDRLSLPWQERSAPPSGEVAQVATLWSDGIICQPDPSHGSPIPGLACRVYLFGPRMGDPLAAEGILAIHLYDDNQTTKEHAIPREIWNIDQANLERVLRKDGLGWGYDLWLPWTTYQPETRKVTMVLHYKPHKGREVWSSSTVLAVSSQHGRATPSQLQARKEIRKTIATQEAEPGAGSNPAP